MSKKPFRDQGRRDFLRPVLSAGVAGVIFFGSILGLHAAENRWRGDHAPSAASTENFAVARSPRGWQGLWESLGRSAPPGFEDGRDMAVLLQLGRRPTAGYGITLLAAEKKGLFLVVLWQERPPSAGVFVPQVVTNPWGIEKLAKTDMPVLFLKEGDVRYALPRLEYFKFKSAFPRCAAALEGALPSGTSLFVIDSTVIAPFLKEHAPCADR